MVSHIHTGPHRGLCEFHINTEKRREKPFPRLSSSFQQWRQRPERAWWLLPSFDHNHRPLYTRCLPVYSSVTWSCHEAEEGARMSVCSFCTQHLSISRVNGSRLPGLTSPPTSLAMEISPWGLTYSSMQVSKSEYHWESSVQHFWWETQGQICISMEFLKILAEGWVTQPCFRYPTKRHPPHTHFLCAYGCRICCDSTVCFYRAGRGDITWEFRVG